MTDEMQGWVALAIYVWIDVLIIGGVWAHDIGRRHRMLNQR